MTPIPCTFDGESFFPLWRHKKQAEKQFTVGMTYPLVVQEERSQATHRHYFACIHEAWLNLPEDLAEQFATSEHLRKWALIKAGYADEQQVVCGSVEEAQRLAAFIRPIDDYAVVTVNGPVVTRYTAKSQSVRSMDKATFKDSKDKVLDVVSALTGLDAVALKANAGRAA